MAHQIENMFYVGKKPWHGLGVEVNEDIGIYDGLDQSGLHWYVDKLPLYLDDGTIVPDYYATVRMSDRSVLGVVGSRYTVLQNDDAFKWFEPYIESKLVKLHTAGSLQNGRRVWILAKVNGIFTVAKNDDLELFLLLSHSHDGSLQVDVGTTPIRVVCANTLRMAHTDSASKLFKVKHGKNVKRSLEDLKHDIERILFGFETTLNAYKFLASIRVSQSQLTNYVRDVFRVAEEKEVSTRLQNQMDRVEQLFVTGMGNNLTSVAGTAWAAYNAVTQWLAYERGNSPDSRINSLWFGDSVKWNQRALDCALSIN